LLRFSVFPTSLTQPYHNQETISAAAVLVIIATALALMVAKVVRVAEVDQTSVDKVLAKDKKLGGAICTPFFYIKIKSCSKSHAYVEAIR
jgi:hypothetical protein